MEQKEIENQVFEIVRSILGRDDIGMDTVLLGTGGVLDSVGIVQLLGMLENRMGFEFDDDDLSLESLSTVESLMKLVSRLSQ